MLSNQPSNSNDACLFLADYLNKVAKHIYIVFRSSWHALLPGWVFNRGIVLGEGRKFILCRTYITELLGSIPRSSVPSFGLIVLFPEWFSKVFDLHTTERRTRITDGISHNGYANNKTITKNKKKYIHICKKNKKRTFLYRNNHVYKRQGTPSNNLNSSTWLYIAIVDRCITIRFPKRWLPAFFRWNKTKRIY